MVTVLAKALGQREVNKVCVLHEDVSIVSHHLCSWSSFGQNQNMHSSSGGGGNGRLSKECSVCVCTSVICLDPFTALHGSSSYTNLENIFPLYTFFLSLLFKIIR